ncbi:uncharacterized protein STEHIDRAFT_59904, partial [Stereum hirsutum FP-91666 SS1]|uniref:uncharacterized protein n=1 Tax=Stereum hirsutum (strain FP-91666) TaxID=721885 RepID=UPI000444A3CD
AILTQCHAAAALIILLYDHCITLGPEIGLIWLRRPWSTSQRTLVFLRYLVAASQIYTAFVVLVLRLYALWDHRRRVLYGLLAGFVILANQVFFDIWVFGSTVVNAASRPRGADVKLIKDIQRDGGLFFFVRGSHVLRVSVRI